MAEGIKGMPKFQEQTARYSLHIHIASELLRLFNAGLLEAMSMCEQVPPRRRALPQRRHVPARRAPSHGLGRLHLPRRLSVGPPFFSTAGQSKEVPAADRAAHEHRPACSQDPMPPCP